MVVTRKSLHEIVLNQICEEMSYATATSPTQKLPYAPKHLVRFSAIISSAFVGVIDVIRSFMICVDD